MKTLFDKLKSEYKEMLPEIKEESPTAHHNIMKSLNGKDFIIELTIDEAHRITTHFGTPDALNGIYELFN